MSHDRDCRQLLHDVVERYRSHPVDMLGLGDADGEYNYLKTLEGSFVRTLSDVDRILGGGGKTVLEIGSFLGPVSISLRKMGYRVHALDIPEYHASESLRALYSSHGIPFEGRNLRKGSLPYDSASFDAVVMCETLEHLNFNPLPVLAEINRVLKEGGYLYLGMPNQAWLKNRVKLLLGKSIHNPIRDFELQLDRRSNMIVGLHWREYTLQETVQMAAAMGFRTVRKYFSAENRPKRRWKALLAWIAYRIPSFRPSQVVICQKTQSVNPDFHRTEANT